MRPLVVAASCSCAVLWVVFGLCAYSEPGTTQSISFALPFEHVQNGDDAPRTRPAVADKLKPDLNVVLVGKKICKARTGAAFTFLHAGMNKIQATYLLDYAKCDLNSAYVAVIGVEAEAVRPIPPQVDHFPLPKEIESKARRHLMARKAADRRDHGPVRWIPDSDQKPIFEPLSLGPPKTFRVQKGVLLQFTWSRGDNGPAIWVVKDRVFLLPGVCTDGYQFFTVHGRLHLAYGGSRCCDCGENILYIYDLSGSIPKKVYENGALST